MDTVTFTPINEAFLRVESDSQSVLYDLEEHFAHMSENYRFDVRYRNKVWDGKIRPFSARTRLLPAGLAWEARSFLEEDGCVVDVGSLMDLRFDPQEVATEVMGYKITNDRGEVIRPYDVQVKAAVYMVCRGRGVAILPTATGKSLISYLVLRFLLGRGAVRKALVVVPRSILVSQLVGDFEAYSRGDDWPAREAFHSVPGAARDFSEPVGVTTWQSVVDQPREWFEQFDCWMADEAHGVKAKSLRHIGESLTRASYRLGMTGTLPDERRTQVEALLGPSRRFADASTLAERGIISKCRIRGVDVKYPDEFRESVFDACSGAGPRAFALEAGLLYSYERRNRLIARICSGLRESNTVVFFNKIEHGGVLRAMLEAELQGSGRRVFYVDGSMSGEEQDAVRREVDKSKGAVLLASIQCFSTGANVRNLGNMLFPLLMRAEVTVLQAVGRLLRRGDDGLGVTVYDFCDDLSYRGRDSYSQRHSCERMEYYARSGFPIEVTEVSI